MPAWAMPCPKCDKRIEWDGEFHERPKCPRCFPKLPHDSISFPALSDESVDAIKQCDLILSLLDELPESVDDFSDSVREKTQSILEWIKEKGHCTERQASALDNMEGGVRKWIER